MLPQTQIRDIAHPDLIGRRRQRLTQASVARLLEELVHSDRAPVQAANAGAQPLLAHQPCHALVAAANALAFELLVHTWRAIAAAAVAVDALDPGAQLLIVTAAAAALTGVPCVEPAPGNLIALAQEGHLVLVAVLGYELEFRLRRSILKRMAFFKRSCSTSSAASLRSSARTAMRASTLASNCFTCRCSACFSGSRFGARNTFGKLNPAASAAGLSLPSR